MSDADKDDAVDDPLARARWLRRAGRAAEAVELLEQTLAGFEDSSSTDRSEEPGPAERSRDLLQHAELARERIRAYCALDGYREALAAADYANEVHAALPEGPDRAAQRVHLLAECAAVLIGLDCAEDAELLVEEAVQIVRGRFEAAHGRSDEYAVAALRQTGAEAERLLRRLDALGFQRQYAELAELLVTLRGQVATLDPGAPQQFELAACEEAVGLAYQRIGDGRSGTHLESASSLYLALAEAGDQQARLLLARLLQKIAALQDGRSEGDVRRVLREALHHLSVLWSADPGTYGPAYLDGLESFCASVRGRAHLDDERSAALAEAERVIAGLDDEQQRACAELIEQLRRESALPVAAAPNPLAGAPVAGAPLASRRQGGRRARRTLIMVSGAVLALLLGLFLAVVLYQEPRLRCAELELDGNGEEVCARWENSTGVSRTPLLPDG